MPTTRPAIKITIVRPAGQAEAAGLQPGDVLVEIGGTVIDSPEALSQRLQSLGTDTQATIIRNGSKCTVALAPGALGISYSMIDIEIPDSAATRALSNEESEALRQQRLRDMIVTTAPSVEGHHITQQLGIVTAECVFGMNMFRDFFAAVRDVFGGRSAATQQVLRDARETCLRELKEEAIARGANAVIAVDLDYSEFSGEGKSMLFLVASGTAVKVEQKKEA